MAALRSTLEVHLQGTRCAAHKAKGGAKGRLTADSDGAAWQAAGLRARKGVFGRVKAQRTVFGSHERPASGRGCQRCTKMRAHEGGSVVAVSQAKKQDSRQ